MVKFALFTFRSVRVSVFQRVQSVFRERERGVLLWSESSYDASLRMKKRENEKLCCENERNVPHLLQVNNIFVARRLECIGIPPTFSSPTLFSSVVLVDDDSASIRSLLGCSDANEESSRVFLLFVLLLVVVLLLLENGDSETTFQEDFCCSSDDDSSDDDDAFVVVFLTKERFRRRREEEEEEEEFVDLLLWRRWWSRWCEKTREQWYERDVMFNSQSVPKTKSEGNREKTFVGRDIINAKG